MERVSAPLALTAMMICFGFEWPKSIAAISCGNASGDRDKRVEKAANVLSAFAFLSGLFVTCHTRNRFIAATEFAEGSAPSYSSRIRNRTDGSTSVVAKYVPWPESQKIASCLSCRRTAQEIHWTSNEVS